jgi:DNA-binding NtrC family response regulator
MLLDLLMPDETGLAFLTRLPHPLTVPVVVLSGEASPSDAVTALRLGATDFVEKPPTTERLLTAIHNALRLSSLTEERARLCEALARPGHLVGDSPAMNQLRNIVAKVGPTEALVLIQGETGTGKERVARALHMAGGRKGRFVAINCAAIPSTLLESELFGYERGAFSGATSRHLGRFEQAEGGTILLDEIGDMPLELQAKLLRVLEEREVERLGGTSPISIDARVLASTHRDLEKAVAEGKFREDLYFRLAVFPLGIPPLRNHPDDIPMLIQAFAADLIGAHIPVTLVPGAESILRRYRWPGNIRELRNFIERLCLMRSETELLIDENAVLPLNSLSMPAQSLPPVHRVLGEMSYRELVEEFERSLLREALLQTQGNVAEAARLLRVDRGNLFRRIQALDIAVKEAE